MDLDQEICLCFHVTQRKIVNYLRTERPRIASQLSECHGAGTGCGWCRPFLQRLFDVHRAASTRAGDVGPVEVPDALSYAEARQVYLAQQKTANPKPLDPDTQ